jgi:uncharacterized protein YpmS
MLVKNTKGRQVQFWKGFLALTALLFASLACNLPGGARPPVETTPIPVTTESVEQLQENLEEAATQASTTGQVTMVVDEAQLTSLVAIELESQEEKILEDPQVYLREGQIQLYGTAVQGGISLPISVIATVHANEQGEAQYEIVEANAGPLPLPQSILDQFTDQLDQAIGSRLDPENTNIFIDDITIADGKMTISGHTR